MLSKRWLLCSEIVDLPIMSFRIFSRRFATLVRCRHTLHFYPCCLSVLRASSPFVDKQRIDVLNLTSTHFSEYSGENATDSKNITPTDYERISGDTLETLTEYFEELIEDTAHLKSPDVMYGDGVLTVQFGEPHGTYVINRQTPNLQIWLSSPSSGPKRYDFIDGHWIYRHDGVSLHDLLNEEISKIIQHPVDFKRCSFSSSITEK